MLVVGSSLRTGSPASFSPAADTSVTAAIQASVSKTTSASRALSSVLVISVWNTSAGVATCVTNWEMN
ncbi:hypothetical protein J2T31_000659 [Kerstersia gyiorum]|nr:hypothetical protein [Kerstersia gyiorum]MCP1822151.1 hypothetical protein [Kerstersia gyiorum]MCP1825575.1 hypothetical protein [Kerstersia gyiorum]MCW2449451.1 hypothetical protein [Kerstersia gyiorum]